MTMSPEDLQGIFRHRHILVINAPLPDEGFSLKTLKAYTKLTKVVDMQGRIHFAPIYYTTLTLVQTWQHVVTTPRNVFSKAR
jgi:hypothetical protein